MKVEDLQKMIQEGVAAALANIQPPAKAKGKGKPGRKPLSDDDKAKNRAKIDAETVKNFQKAGYKDVQPRENVKTYNKWLEVGRRVKKNEKSIKCGSFALFHIDQTEPVVAPSETTVH